MAPARFVYVRSAINGLVEINALIIIFIIIINGYVREKGIFDSGKSEDTACSANIARSFAEVF